MSENDGKQEFTAFYEYIKKNKNVVYSQDPRFYTDPKVRTSLIQLYNTWSQKNKTIKDYFEIKSYHFNVNFLCSKLYPRHKYKQLWSVYVETARAYRMKLLMSKTNHFKRSHSVRISTLF